MHSPWYLLLLLILPILAWRLFSSRHQVAVRFSSVRLAGLLRPTLRQRLLWLPKALTLTAIACMIIGIARPREGREQTVSSSEGIAIEMVVDRSGSMQALDFKIDGQQVDRLTAIKSVASKFITGGEGLAGRFSDLVGLITFAGYADGIAPPTLDHNFVVAQLLQAQIVNNRDEDGTAIGDAISLAVEKLTALDARQKEKVKSKVVILLTDGENTAGAIEPLAAAELAQTLGIKIYTIGVGTNGTAEIMVRNPFGRMESRQMEVRIDEATLQQVASLTQGKYFRATDTDSLEQIYEEIDRLEKTEVEAKHYVDYRELAVQSYRTRYVQVPAILMIAFSLLLVRVVLEQTWLRELT
jgi:Ca-activated chloride channel homolog